jgi:hypothetical protein
MCNRGGHYPVKSGSMCTPPAHYPIKGENNFHAYILPRGVCYGITPAENEQRGQNPARERRGLAWSILPAIPRRPGADISLSLFESGGHRENRVVDIIALIRRMGQGINALYRAI